MSVLYICLIKWTQSGKSATLSRKPYNNFAVTFTLNFICMRIPTIFEIATAYENRKTGEIDQKPNTNIVVSTTRIGYGKKAH